MVTSLNRRPLIGEGRAEPPPPSSTGSVERRSREQAGKKKQGRRSRLPFLLHQEKNLNFFSRSSLHSLPSFLSSLLSLNSRSECKKKDSSSVLFPTIEQDREEEVEADTKISSPFSFLLFSSRTPFAFHSFTC